MDPVTGILEWRSQLVGRPPSPLFDVIDRAILPEASRRYGSAVEMQQAVDGRIF
ncbi:MAG: hypothetical protein HC810_00005, partial [Acaryochloridaceae cyanobacterium RL_2_7]|nr:hypothetical protein [Acaryochloridaceae cyanobacterium RL_2_7]